jgi:hypothetical protein
MFDRSHVRPIAWLLFAAAAISGAIILRFSLDRVRANQARDAIVKTLNSEIANNVGNWKIEGRLFPNENFQFTGKEVCDLTPMGSLVEKALFPCEVTDVKVDRWPTLGELTFQNSSGVEQTFEVISSGNGPIGFDVKGGDTIYVRTKPANKLYDLEYFDESTGLCAIIRGIANGDKNWDDDLLWRLQTAVLGREFEKRDLPK